ncbi:MAG: alpha-glucosidase/alpha-galactosidase [Lachnospiraceae bacterium]|nr:alpha-glucosidase/alpha-galactosidase [Lachnospiraceae bacterium]
MKNSNLKAKNLNITYIGGGSRQWAWTFMTDLALEPELGGTIRLYDIDTAAAKNNEIIGNRISALPETKGKWLYQTITSLEEAVTGADIIIISILPGTFKDMHSDVHLPERLGIYQSVGDTAGPGGIIRSLRTIPPFVTFAEVIRACAPQAWVINYTNPMSICMRTLYHVFPEIKAFGCCHEVFGMQSLLAMVVNRNPGVGDVGRRDIKVNVLGLNHFTWFDSAFYQDLDLFDMYRRFVDEFYETGFETDASNLPDRCFSSNNRVKFDLFRRYGWIAAAGDRHLAEFMPGTEYLKNPEVIESWGFYLTSVDWRIKDLEKRRARSERLVTGAEDIILSPSGEEGILLIKALCGLGDVVSNVNLPNTAKQIANLPLETVVETNAVFSYDSVIPANAGKLSDEILALTEPHVKNQTDILEAGLNNGREAVHRAFGRDPLVCNYPEYDRRKLAEDMIRMADKDISQEP